MVEEMMLLANCTVAERCLAHFAACALLRRHPTPPPRQFDPLLRAAAAAGVSIDPATSKALAASLDGAVREADPYFNKLIRIMATRCMTQAVYFSSGARAPPPALPQPPPPRPARPPLLGFAPIASLQAPNAAATCPLPPDPTPPIPPRALTKNRI